MGYMRHHAIIVSSWDRELLSKAHFEAKIIFPTVSDVLESRVNGHGSFFIPPDGSKESWELSDTGDEERHIFLQWLNAHRYSDGSSALKWAEVQYGDDEGKNRLVSSDAKPQTKTPRVVRPEA